MKWLARNRRWKLVGLGLAVLIVLGVPSAYFGGKYVLARRAMAWRQQGFAAAAARDHEQAAQLLGRYLRRRPDDVEALRQYIECRQVAELPNGQHLTETLGALKLLLAAEPGSVDGLKQLLELNARLERREEALDVANQLLNLSKEKGERPDPRVLETKVAVLDRMRQHHDALDAANAWKIEEPGSVKAHIAYLTARSRLEHKGEELVAYADGKDDPASVAALGELGKSADRQLLLGFAYAEAGDHAKAAEELKNAAKHNELRDDRVTVIVALFERMGMIAEATALLQRQARAGSGSEIRYALARRLWEQGEWAGVSEMLHSLNASDFRSDSTLLAFKAMALANLGRKDDATAVRAALAKRNQAGARAWSLIVDYTLDNSTVDDKRVIAECRSALMTDWRNPYLHYYLGDAQRRTGEIDLAIESWKRSADFSATWVLPSVRLVDTLIYRGRPQWALTEALAAVRRNPHPAIGAAAARAFQVNVHAMSGPEVDRLLEFMKEVEVGGEDQLLQIQLLAHKGSTESKSEATEEIIKALKVTPPPNERTLLRIAEISRHHKLALEQQCFDLSEKTHGLTPALALGKALDRLLAGEAKGGLSLFDSMSAGKAPALQWQVARARYLDAMGDPGARGAWAALGSAYPNDAAVLQAILAAKSVQGDWDTLSQAIDRLRAITGESGLVWRLSKAKLMVESPRPDADVESASVLLNEVLRDHPRSSEAHILLARALVRMGRSDGAIERLTAAVKLDPLNRQAGFMLAQQLVQRGDFERAREELDRVLPMLRLPQERREAAKLLAQAGQTERAVRILQDLPRPQDAREGGDLLLAMLHASTGETDKAKEELQKLLKDKPDLAAVRYAASFYGTLRDQDNARGALKHLDTMKQLDPGVKELVLGAYEAQFGDPAEAFRLFRAATQAAPNQAAPWRALMVAEYAAGRTDEALAALAQATGSVPGDKGFTWLTARSALLRDLAGDGLLRPLGTVLLRDPLNGVTAAELAQTVLDARRSDDMEQQASRLRQFVERHPNYLPAQMLLAHTHAMMGRDTDAIMIAQSALGAFPTSPEPAITLVHLHSRANRWQQSLSAAQAWKSRARDLLPADLAIARAQLGLKQFVAAERQLAPYLTVKEMQDDPDRNGELLVLYYGARINTGHARDAEERMWPAAQRSPAGRARWMDVGVFFEDPAGAAAWLERVATVIPPKESAAERVRLAEVYAYVGQKLVNPDLKQRGEQLLAEMAKAPQATIVELIAAAARAELHVEAAAPREAEAAAGGNDAQAAEQKKLREQHLATAESLYRRVLDIDSNVWPAQNNLAMVILRRKGDAREAVSLAAAAVKAQPRLATVYDTLAQAQGLARDPRAAAETIRAAIRLEPENAKWRVRLAQYLLDAGDAVGATAALGEIDARRLDTRHLPPHVERQLVQLRDELRRGRQG